MKKFILMAAMLALVVVAAVPALAASNGNGNDWWNNNNNDRGNNNNNNPFNNNNNDPFHNNNPFNNSNGGISQSNEQEVQSGDSSQTFNVTGGGDNSNQCVGIQGVSNTGSLNNNTGVLQYGSDGNVETSGGDFTISPSSSTTCNQKVDQAASASGW